MAVIAGSIDKRFFSVALATDSTEVLTKGHVTHYWKSVEGLCQTGSARGCKGLRKGLQELWRIATIV